jgi:hypothetical protein
VLVSFVHGDMHSDWFNGIEILQVRGQHGDKVGYSYPSRLEKYFLYVERICLAGHERVKFGSFYVFYTFLK